MKYQFNKTAMNKMQKDLSIRLHALPTLKAKETALRLEVKKYSETLKTLENEYQKLQEQYSFFAGLWHEYPEILNLQEATIEMRNIAGVKIPYLKEMTFTLEQVSLFANRAWVVAGSEVLKEFCSRVVQINLTRDAIGILHLARKKTTQKVNLYEKVQIPEYREAIRKIKRFLEDTDNLSKAGQKIIKKRQEVQPGATA